MSNVPLAEHFHFHLKEKMTRSSGLLNEPTETDLWRLPKVLSKIPVSRSGWLAGVRAGRYPAPVRLSVRCVAWRAADIYSLIASL